MRVSDRRWGAGAISSAGFETTGTLEEATAVPRRIGGRPRRTRRLVKVLPCLANSLSRGRAAAIARGILVLTTGLARGWLDAGVASPPLVSVILPTRDRPERLRIALESLVAQTHPAVEAIVVNDGGVDVSDVIAAIDRRRMVVSIRLPERRERSAARNCGLRVARGTYVAYLDDDDWYDPEHLATLVDTLERERAAVAYTCARRVTEELRGDRWVPTGVDVPFRRFFDPTMLLMGNYIPMLTLAHRRDCLDTIGHFDEDLTALEDWELCIRLSRRWPFVAIPRLTCNFTWREPVGEAADRRLRAFVRSTEIIYRRYAADAAPHPEVVRVHAEFFRKARALDAGVDVTA